MVLLKPKRCKSKETKLGEGGGNDSEGESMNRNATKVSDYGQIFHGRCRTEMGLLCSNDGRSRLGRKEEAEGQMMER